MEGISPHTQEFPRPTIELEQVSSPEEFLKAVDFRVLNDIFDEISRKAAGTSKAKTSGYLVSPDKIRFKEPEDGEKRSLLGEANIPSGRINLIWEQNEENKDSKHKNVKVLSTLMHESAHVRGGYVCERWDSGPSENFEWSVGYFFRKGLQEYRSEATQAGDTKTRVGMSLNEAVTENISHDVLAEYLLRTGKSSYLTDPTLSGELGLGSYVHDRLVLAVIIEALSIKFGIDRGEVWKGFVQAYMSGNIEIHDLLSKIGDELTALPSVLRALGLGSETILTIDVYTEVIDQIESPAHRLAILNQITRVIDLEKVKNALGLR